VSQAGGIVLDSPAMRPGIGDRRLRAERRLFDVHARLVRARSELAIVEEQYQAFAEMAEEARMRMLISETALAHQEWQEARRHAETMERSCAEARTLVADLERTQNELLDELVV